MCVKLPPGDLNPDSYPLHLISTYTYGVTIAPRVCGGIPYELLFLKMRNRYSFIK